MKLKKKVKVIIAILIVAIIPLTIFLINKNNLKAVSSDNKAILFTVYKGDTREKIINNLKEAGLIRSKTATRNYIKINGKNNFKSGLYELKKNMSTKEIIDSLNKSYTLSKDTIYLTFNEGWTIKKIAKAIASKTSFTENDVYNLMKDDTFLRKMADKYEIIDYKTITNKDIKYPLEGYLYPDTYAFDKGKTSLEELFSKMIYETNKILTKDYKTLYKGDKTYHEILTMASIAEKESKGEKDRKIVAGILYKRLSINMPLGSDVTTYYGLGLELNERDLSAKEFNEYNPYNTRSNKLAGKLPVGPICSPYKTSILAALDPEKTDYLYFVSDKNSKMYYNTNLAGHNATIAKLKNEGLWFVYE